MKANRCRTIGMDSQSHHLPDTASTTDAVALVSELANDDTMDGILVQHPMPPQVVERQVFEAITPTKDVDGVTATSFAAMALDEKGFKSCTPGGIMYLLDAYDVCTAGQRAMVIGHSRIAGQPTLANRLLLMWRWVTEIERPEARVMGADPA